MSSSKAIAPANYQAVLIDLQEKLGYDFEDISLLVLALSHRSYGCQKGRGGGNCLNRRLNGPYYKCCPQGKTLAGCDNQRLEFLGDAVLGLSISAILYEKFSGLKEGLLSRIRAGLVCEAALNKLALELNLGQALLLGPGEKAGGGQYKPSILADALEAVIGAIFLEAGFEKARAVVAGLWATHLERTDLKDSLADYKTRLQEITQELAGQVPQYRLIASEGPDHAKVFTVSVILDGRELGRASGHSKKDAEQKAAGQALADLRQTRKAANNG